MKQSPNVGGSPSLCEESPLVSSILPGLSSSSSKLLLKPLGLHATAPSPRHCALPCEFAFDQPRHVGGVPQVWLSFARFEAEPLPSSDEDEGSASTQEGDDAPGPRAARARAVYTRAYKSLRETAPDAKVGYSPSLTMEGKLCCCRHAPTHHVAAATTTSHMHACAHSMSRTSCMRSCLSRHHCR